MISPNTTVHLTKKGYDRFRRLYTRKLLERYQLQYTQFVDLKAMMGDKSDNLPGIPGIGEKKAVKYLQQYNTLDEIIAHSSEIKGVRMD